MNIFIDPPYKDYYENQLFNSRNLILNRDDTLAPFIRMRTSLTEKNINVNTADYLFSPTNDNQYGDYYSFGLLHNLDQLSNKKNIRLKSFVIFEPPVVAPKLYDALPQLTEIFETVYIHNTLGDGYSLDKVNVSKLRKLYWPQPYNTVIDKYWNKLDRKNRIVVINGHHKPISYHGELYSKRIEVIAQLKNSDYVDLYGRGWQRWWSRSSMWLPYLKNRGSIMSVYKGSCESKLEILSQYNFSLCFENMYMDGYITEKIFDCFYAGTIPIYMGAKNIDKLIPSNAYIDFRNFNNIEDLLDYLRNIQVHKLHEYRQAASCFIKGQEGMKYYHSILELIKTHSLKI